ncbi:MAG: choice-of-anchor Q domain-containing protein [Chitinophagales bacterium]|nr:choice-of-anchor Q domain-containing protein [Chitinophagales bacterium]
MRLRYFIFLSFIGVFIFSSCRKDIIDTDPSLKLSFSTDTLTFDTVFTTLGSTTLYFKIYNDNKNAVKTNVTLAGGDASNFRINADGIPDDQQGLEIFGKDSTYVFVEVTVDPNGMNTPLIITDSVIFETNGNRQKVILAAWGQDAFYFNDSLITTTTWLNTKPYVIFNAVGVDSGQTLTIEQGTQIYMGGNAQLIVFGTGKINVTGTKEEPVVFQGVRLEEFYDNLPGQWSGIFILRGSTGNSFDYAVIKNSDFGVNLGSIPNRINDCNDIGAYFSFSNAPQATLRNTVIQNSFQNGLSGLLAQITAENCLLFNSGDHLVSFSFGGIYNMNHCTLANYGSSTVNHQTSTLFLSNVLVCDNTIFPAEMEANFDNTIVYGSLDEEISFSVSDTAFFSAIFDHCLVKTEYETDTLDFVNCIFNLDPQFVDRAEEDYSIEATSPCRDSGKVTLVTTDLNGNPRIDTPDIGAYEYQ